MKFEKVLQKNLLYNFLTWLILFIIAYPLFGSDFALTLIKDRTLLNVFLITSLFIVFLLFLRKFFNEFKKDKKIPEHLVHYGFSFLIINSILDLIIFVLLLNAPIYEFLAYTLPIYFIPLFITYTYTKMRK